MLIAGDGIEALAYAGCDLGRVPIWAFHGSADRRSTSWAAIRPINVLETCTDPKPSTSARRSTRGVGHNSWDRTYDLSAGHDIYAWLLTHQHA